MPSYDSNVFGASDTVEFLQSDQNNNSFAVSDIVNYVYMSEATDLRDYSDFVYFASARSASSILVQFVRVLGGASIVPADYVITGPSAITVDSVSVGASSVTLTVSGTWAPGLYTLTIGSLKCYDTASNFAVGNATFTEPAAVPGGGSNFNTGFN